MKKLFAVVIVLSISVLLVSTSFAQAKKGENVVTFGLGFGYPGAYGSSSMPPLFLSYDRAIQNRISVGGIVS